MARQKCTFKWQDKSVDKSVRLNGKEKCTFKWQDKSVRLNGKDKSVRLNGKTKVNV